MDQAEPLFAALLDGRLPVFGATFLTGQLRAAEARRVLREPRWLLQGTTQLLGACRHEEQTTFPYALNRPDAAAAASGFDFVALSSAGNIAEHCRGFRFVRAVE